MNRMMLLTTTALLGLAAAGTSYADGLRPAPSSAGAQIVRHGPSNNGSACSLPILYEQDPTSTGRADSGIGIVSQNFESTFDQYDAQAADDFKVPAGGWTISEVEVTGVYFNGAGPSPSETVTFYQTDTSRAKDGRPGTVIASYTVTGVDTGGSFCMSIPSTVLGRGHYWMSVVANMDFSVGGEWAWENLVPPKVTSRTKWQNPGDGFATLPHCVHWKVENRCIPDGQGDHIFILR